MVLEIGPCGFHRREPTKKRVEYKISSLVELVVLCYGLMLIDVQQLNTHQSHILRLQLLLLSGQEVVLLGQQLDGVLHAQAELLIHQFVTLGDVVQLFAG